MSSALAFPSHADPGLSNDQVLAFVADEATHALVQAALQVRWPTSVVHVGGLSAALGTLSQEPSPRLLVIDMAGSEDPVGSLRSLQTLCEPSTRIVVLGLVNDVMLYRGLSNAGASDYLVKPFAPEDLAAALVGAERVPAAGVPDETELRIITVIGARGGVGASTFAVNVAWLMAHDLGKTVGLIDLDLQFGTVALALDLEPSHGLREAFEKPDRIDGLFVASAMAHESERLFVLGSEEPLDRPIAVKTEAFDVLVNSLPENFDCLVVDLPARLAIDHPEWLVRSKMVAIVSDLSLTGMRDTTRIAMLARDSAPDAGVTVIANRVGALKSGELPKAEFQRGTELPVRHYLPADFKLATEASNAGKPLPLIGRRSPLVKELRKAAETLVGERAVAGQPTGIKKFLRLK